MNPILPEITPYCRKKKGKPILTMKYGVQNKIKPHIIKIHPILSKINPILTDPILTETK
jgi:hypothetical protein